MNSFFLTAKTKVLKFQYFAPLGLSWNWADPGPAPYHVQVVSPTYRYRGPILLKKLLTKVEKNGGKWSEVDVFYLF